MLSKLLNKYKSTPVQVRASLWYTVCNILQRGISFITIPLYTRILSTAEYGNFSVFQSWRDIIIIFATLNLYCGVFTRAMVKIEDKAERDRYTASMQGLSTAVTTLLFIVYLCATSFWERILEMGSITMLLLFAYFIAFPAFSFWSARQRVEYKYVKMIILTLLMSVATPVLSLVLLFATPLRVEAVIWGSLIVQIVFGSFFYVLQFIRGKAFFVKDHWISALKFNIPLIPHYLSLIILGQSNRIMIKEFCGEDKAGIYNLAHQVSLAMNIVISALNNSLVPWTYEKLKAKDYAPLKSTTLKICGAMAACTLGIILIGPEIIGFLGTEEYKAAIWIVPGVAVSCYFTFCYGLFSNVEFYFGATKFVMVASAIGAALNIALNFIFIPMFGFIAAGYTTLVCYFAFMVMHYLFMRRICKKETGGNNIYANFALFISCFVLTAAGGGIMLLYGLPLVRYGIILIALGLAIIFRNRIFGLLKSIR